LKGPAASGGTTIATALTSSSSFQRPLKTSRISTSPGQPKPMGAGGLEPPQRRRLRILSPLRLPIPPCPRPEHPKLPATRRSAVQLPGFLQSVSPDLLLVLVAYALIGGAYLVAVPLLLYAWMIKRWTVMGKLERLGVYGLVFLFFPGLILFAPFINLRMAGQGNVLS